MLSGDLCAQGSGCEGRLGNNIFLDGDFGSGTDNVLQTDPGLAPGYFYTTSMPPNDGEYTLSNNTGAWNDIWGAWLLLRDNSNDPNGYMMVVNADFSPGIFYEETIQNICGNTLYEFSADILNINRAESTDHSLPNIDFLIDGDVAFNTGNIPRNESWNTYGFTFTTPPGATSIQLALRNNAPGGIGNDLALDNISFRPCGPEVSIIPENNVILCEEIGSVTFEALFQGNPSSNIFVEWQVSNNGGITWQTFSSGSPTFPFPVLPAGRYLVRIAYANSLQNLSNEKCKLYSDRVEVEIIQRTYLLIDTICQGLEVVMGGVPFDQTGIYRDTFQTVQGCDSIVVLDLTIVPDPDLAGDIIVENPLCFGDSSGQIRVENLVRGTPPFQILLEEEVLITSPNRNFELPDIPAGSYEGRLVDRYGCFFEFEAVLEDPIKLEISVLGDSTIRLGESANIWAVSNTPGTQFEFAHAAGLSCTICQQTEAALLNTTLLYATGTNESGCTAIDSHLINVTKEYPIYTPNVFSPNGDGVNDFFNVFPEPLSTTTIQSLTIFDRWGGLVYQATNLDPRQLSNGWDGSYRGKPLDAGVYIYIADILFIDGNVLRKSGSVTLVR